jgi:hypothetical protein
MVDVQSEAHATAPLKEIGRRIKYLRPISRGGHELRGTVDAAVVPADPIQGIEVPTAFSTIARGMFRPYDCP